MLRIGLTGGIGSGKSTVAALFARHGAPVIDTDVIARELVEPGQPALKEIVDRFGPEMLDPNGRLNRSRLGERVFSDASERLALESILHPSIRATVAERLGNLDAPYCIVVIPLLVETGAMTTMVDRVLVVDTPEEQQIARVAARDHLTDARIRAILKVQATREERLAKADDVIVNDRDIGSLEAAVANLNDRYRVMSVQND